MVQQLDTSAVMGLASAMQKLSTQDALQNLLYCCSDSCCATCSCTSTGLPCIALPAATYILLSSTLQFVFQLLLQLAEMVQHLEISAVMGMACATYKSHPHLLQFFAPHAAIGEPGF
jgi:hypothetical protein